MRGSMQSKHDFPELIRGAVIVVIGAGLLMLKWDHLMSILLWTVLGLFL